MTYFTSWKCWGGLSLALFRNTQMVGRQLTTSSPTKPHKWSWSATAGIIQMLQTACWHFTKPKHNLSFARYTPDLRLCFTLIRELIIICASYLSILTDEIIIAAIKSSHFGVKQSASVPANILPRKIPLSPHHCQHQHYKSATLISTAPI